MDYWEKNKDYPTKRAVCDMCHQKSDLKLSFDRIRYICLNAHSCLLRWRKDRSGFPHQDNLND